jgi:hypothetical protein
MLERTENSMRKATFFLATAGLAVLAVPAVALSAGSASAATVSATARASVTTARVGQTTTRHNYTVCYTTRDGNGATSTCLGSDSWYQILECTSGEYHESRTVVGTGSITQECKSGTFKSAEVMFVTGA